MNNFQVFKSASPGYNVVAGGMFYSHPIYEDTSPTQSQLPKTRLIRVPISYMPLEQGQKRILSPENALFTQDKRIRHQSRALSSSDSVALPSGPEMFTMADIMTELRQLRVNAVTKDDLAVFVTKEDLKAVEDKQVAQAEEILQLRALTNTQESRLKQVEETPSKQVIEHTSRVSKPETTEASVNNYGARLGASAETPRWLNVIIHGLHKEVDEDLVPTVISIGNCLGLTVYKEDIRDVYRLPNRDARSTRPPPVLVSFDRPYLRNNFLRRKYDLVKVDKYSEVYLNADEPAEIRKRKGLFRRIATAARSAGETVTMGQDWIKIGNTTYLPDQIDQIPSVFLPRDFPLTTIMQDVDMDTQGASAPRSELAAPPTLPKIPEKIRLTKAGIIFSDQRRTCLTILGLSLYTKVPLIPQLNRDFTIWGQPIILSSRWQSVF